MLKFSSSPTNFVATSFYEGVDRFADPRIWPYKTHALRILAIH